MIEPKDCWLKDTCKKYKEQNCTENFCMKLFKLNHLYDESLIPMQQRSHKNLFIDADGTDSTIFRELKNIENNILDFVDNGKNLFIYSYGVGCGKTSWAIRLIQSYFNNIWYKTELKCKALFINVPRFLIALKQNISCKSDYAEHIMQNVLDADLVIWDEIATKTATEFEHENLLTIIDSRLASNKSNIYTSNLGPEEIKERLGDRIYSRIINTSTVYQFKGKDKRGLNNDSTSSSQ